MNNCPQCHSRNPANAKSCLHCNAALQWTPNATNNTSTPTISNTSNTIGWVLILAAAIAAFVFRAEIATFFANSKSFETICASRLDTNLVADLQSRGYEKCDILSRDQCTQQHKLCFRKTLEEGESKYRQTVLEYKLSSP